MNNTIYLRSFRIIILLDDLGYPYDYMIEQRTENDKWIHYTYCLTELEKELIEEMVTLKKREIIDTIETVSNTRM